MSLELSLERCSVSGSANVSRQCVPCSWTRDGECALTQFCPSCGDDIAQISGGRRTQSLTSCYASSELNSLVYLLRALSDVDFMHHQTQIVLNEVFSLHT